MFLRCVEHLLRNRANASKKDKHGFNAIHYAAVNGHKLAIEMVSTLYRHDSFIDVFCIFSRTFIYLI